MFEVRGDRPQWQTVYERLAAMKIGETIKDEELLGLLPDAPESSVKGAFHKAVEHIEDDLKRSFARVRCVGYVMVEPVAHEGLARGQHKRAKRRMRAAWRKAHSADRSLMNPDERRRLDAVEVHLSQQRDMIQRLDGRVAKVEANLQAARREQNTTAAAMSDRLDKLAALLERHGISENAQADA